MAETSLRWGLLSTARINERLIPAIRDSERSELVAVGSRDGAKAESYAAHWSIPRAHGSYEALIADPGVDALYISLPNGFHEEWTLKAADGGKHVLCEKPLATSTEEVRSMAEAGERNGVVVQDATMMRYHPQTHKVRDLVAGGTIGDVRFVRAVFAISMSKEGDIRFDPTIGGGCLWDLGSYCVNFTRTVLGAEPLEVQGSQILNHTGVDVVFAGQMRFPGDIFAQFSSTFSALAHWEVEILGTTGRIRLDQPFTNMVGADGHVRIERLTKTTTATFGDTAELDMETLTFEDMQAYRCEVDAMEAAVLDGAASVVPLEDSERNIRTLVALYESAREDRKVKLD